MPSPAWLLAALFAFGSPAAQARDPAHPTAHDMAVWKRDVIDQYDRAVYVDERGRQISEQEYFRLVRTELRSHVIETVEGSKALITLRLLPRIDPVFTPGDQATAANVAAWLHALTKPYSRTVYLDGDGGTMSADDFVHAVVEERRSVAMQSTPGNMKLMTLRLQPRAR